VPEIKWFEIIKLKTKKLKPIRLSITRLIIKK
jgi:hypothetical protein